MTYGHAQEIIAKLHKEMERQMSEENETKTYVVTVDFGGNIIDEYEEETDDPDSLRAIALERAKDNLDVYLEELL